MMTEVNKSIYLDVARRYYDMQSLYEVVDIIYENEQKELFLHLSDNEAFRVEMNLFKKTPYKVYSKQEINDLCKYAYERNVMIIPVLDIPSHSGGWLNLLKLNDEERYNKVVSDFDEQTVNYWDDGEPIKFIKSMIDEIADAFKIPGYKGEQIFHLGMDEVPVAISNQKWLFWFMEHLFKHVESHNYIPVIWNDQVTPKFLEMALDAGMRDSLRFSYWQQGLKGTVSPDDIMNNFKLYNGNFYTQTFSAKTLDSKKDMEYMKQHSGVDKFNVIGDVTYEAKIRNVCGSLLTLWGEDSESRPEKEIIIELRRMFTAFVQKVK
ncbi:family 20 glycosylhydrolase [Macrococcoides caseolyticum]|uniref:family 20 glycosylhydrolase n=1 Tax=Macrococcoides caseolyticum TaxID=69966 RepID=UPI000C32E618|nr:family 20 glycosylhydrolase [Macrococcus caseolyticus]PKE22790.1 hypothetical protein CW688_01280 [Macrococcus caseolyticus]